MKPAITPARLLESLLGEEPVDVRKTLNEGDIIIVNAGDGASLEQAIATAKSKQGKPASAGGGKWSFKIERDPKGNIVGMTAEEA